MEKQLKKTALYALHSSLVKKGYFAAANKLFRGLNGNRRIQIGDNNNEANGFIATLTH